MVLDIDAWVRGDMHNFMDSITDIHDVINNLYLFKGKNRPHRKMSFLSQLRSKFFGTIPANLWLDLITQDDNMEIFSYYLTKSPDVRINETYFLNHISNYPGCSWVFCKINSLDSNPNYNVNNLKVFISAINHCINHSEDSKDLCYSLIKQIWHVPVFYKFDALPLIAGKILRKQLESLYTLLDLKIIIPLFQSVKFKYLPLLNLIVSNLSDLSWTGNHQVKLLIELAEDDYCEPVNVVNNTMHGFDTERQRDIWSSLNEHTLSYYLDMDWSLIEHDIIPCHIEMNTKLFNLLEERCEIYDYEEKLLKFIIYSHDSLLKRALNSNLVSLYNDDLWTNPNTKQSSAIIDYWFNNINIYRDLAEKIAEKINKPGWFMVKNRILSNIDALIVHFNGDHCLFKVLLRDPLPSSFVPSENLRRHVFKHIPSMMSLSIYNSFREEIADMIIKYNITISDKALAYQIIHDTVFNHLPAYGKILNSIPLKLWRQINLHTDLLNRLINHIINNLKTGFITYEKNNITTNIVSSSLSRNIASELCYKAKSEIKLPSTNNYIQYVILYYGFSKLESKLLDHILMNDPSTLIFFNKEESYSDFFTIYEHFAANKSEDYIVIEQSVLIDMVGKYPGSKLIHNIFLKRRKNKYSLHNETIAAMPEQVLTDHCINGLIIIKPTQYKYLNKSQIRLIKTDCAVCSRALLAVNSANHLRLPCGHKVHRNCLNTSYSCCDESENIYDIVPII